MQEKEDKDFVKSLFRLSDESGSMTFSLVSEGTFTKSMLDPSDGMYIRVTESISVSLNFFNFHVPSNEISPSHYLSFIFSVHR